MSTNDTTGWTLEEIDSDGDYGSGDDVRTGFKAFCVRNSDGLVLFDTLGRDTDVSEIRSERDDETGAEHAWDELARRDMLKAAAAPELLAALELVLTFMHPEHPARQQVRAAIAKTTGAAALQQPAQAPAAASGAGAPDERAAFEAWASTQWPSAIPPNHAWMGWQARAALAAAPAAAPDEPRVTRLAGVRVEPPVGSQPAVTAVWQAPAAAQAVFDLIAHLRRQRAFSERTFGPGDRLLGVTDHIAKELREVRESGGCITEWVDVILLALDGAWRSGATPEQIAAAIEAKQTRNEGRTWPDWRTAPKDKAIEHDRSGEAGAAGATVEQQAAPLLPLTACAAGSDGDCSHAQCPQQRDGEPAKSGRACPLENWRDRQR